MLLDNELKVGIKEMLIKLNTDLASGLPKAVTQIDGSFTLVNLFAQKAPGEYRIEARFEGNHLYDPCYSERKVIIFEKKTCQSRQWNLSILQGLSDQISRSPMRKRSEKYCGFERSDCINFVLFSIVTWTKSTDPTYQQGSNPTNPSKFRAEPL
jgi:hypothetical protein